MRPLSASQWASLSQCVLSPRCSTTRTLRPTPCKQAPIVLQAKEKKTVGSYYDLSSVLEIYMPWLRYSVLSVPQCAPLQLYVLNSARHPSLVNRSQAPISILAKREEWERARTRKIIWTSYLHITLTSKDLLCVESWARHLWLLCLLSLAEVLETTCTEISLVDLSIAKFFELHTVPLLVCTWPAIYCTTTLDWLIKSY